MVQLQEPHFIGGRYDTVAGKFVGECDEWQVWLIGRKQFEILFGENTTQHNLLFAAEGAGKTTLMAMWVWVQIITAALSGTPGTLGATAPTATRLETFIKAVCDLAPIRSAHNEVQGAWGTLRLDAGELRTATGHFIQFRSTKKQSAATGSPLQGYNFGLGVGMDEIQDSLGAVDDAIARLRAGKNAPLMGTCTAKDSPAFRNFRDSLDAKYWTVNRLSYEDAFAVHKSHWDMMKANLSEREWKRRGLAMDVPPELCVYNTWSRKDNIQPVPALGARDVTREVLARFGRFDMLCGHDPGSLQDVTVMLKAFRLPRQKEHVWFVVDEYRTKRSTSEVHALGLRKHLQEKYTLQYADSDKVLLRCDPYGTTDNKTDRSVYLVFKEAGFDIRSAAYRKGKGNGVVPKEAGIEMVNSLLCNANDERRLFVASDEKGRPAAPLLVEAIELSERDSDGKAESKKKTSKGPGGDLSDFPAALRYALWQVERVRHPYQSQQVAIL